MKFAPVAVIALSLSSAAFAAQSVELSSKIQVERTVTVAGKQRTVLADPAFQQALVNNLVYALGPLVPTLVLALLFALAVQRSTRLATVLRTIFFFPSLVPLVAAASLFFFIFLPGVGLLDFHLGKLGLSGPNWLERFGWQRQR